jgi:sensor histidine kinase YesM
MLSAVLDIGFVAGGAVALKLLRMYFLSREKEKNLAKEKLEAELKFLRAQTNPHFLFNTLNNIYALARKKSDETANVVMKLSKLLRFMLYESREHRITLADELRIIEDYIELEKIRYGERLKVRIQRNIDNSSQEIAPLLLLPFIENAFKHGASETRHQSFIYIDISLNNGNLAFSVQNSKDSDEHRELKENIGLGNVRRQLQLMYPVHSLSLKNENGHFLAELTINLNKDALV